MSPPKIRRSTGAFESPAAANKPKPNTSRIAVATQSPVFSANKRVRSFARAGEPITSTPMAAMAAHKINVNAVMFDSTALILPFPTFIWIMKVPFTLGVVGHFGLAVGDPKQSTRWLQRVLGLRSEFEFDNGMAIGNNMLGLIVGCLKWAAVCFVVAFVLMKLYEGSHIHDDVPRPEFKLRQSRRAALVLSTFAGMLSGLVWLLVQTWD